MSLAEKKDFIKKLIKFGKLAEADSLLRKIINDNKDYAIQADFLEILLFEVELRRGIVVWESIAPLLDIAENNPVFDKDKIEKIKSMEIYRENKPNILLSFSSDFNNGFNFIKNDFSKIIMKNNLMDGWFVEVDFETSKKTAHDQNIKKPYESWNGLRSSIQNELYGVVYNGKIKLDLFEGAVDEINKILDENLIGGGGVFSYFFDDVQSDIYLILMALYINHTNEFIESLFDSYKSGWFPCGWEGEYPKGKMCILNGMK